MVLEGSSPRSRQWQIWCLLRGCFLVHRWQSSCRVLTWWKRQGISLGCLVFIRALIWFMRAPPSWPKHFPKAPPPRTITLGIQFQHMNFGDTQTFSLWQPFWGNASRSGAMPCSYCFLMLPNSSREARVAIVGDECFGFFLIFIYLAAPGLIGHTRDLRFGVRDLFSCGMQALSCGVWDLVPWPGIKPRPPALGARSLNHWTTREVPGWVVYDFVQEPLRLSQYLWARLF